MGYISYNLNFYKQRLLCFETIYKSNPPSSILHEAKVLLKMLHDLNNDGYHELYNLVSSKFDGVNRLENYIKSNNDIPFPLDDFSTLESSEYSSTEFDLFLYLKKLLKISKLNTDTLECNPFFNDLLSYSKSIYSNSNKDTSYIFLLRDTLLPYIAFKKWDINSTLNTYPWILSRQFLKYLSGDNSNLDDTIRATIFSTIEEHSISFNEFKKSVKVKLLNTLKDYPQVIETLKNMMSSIHTDKILVVETGYNGTFPMLLSCLDDRVDFIMFTTVPYFYDIYRGKYFTNQYEKNNFFETIQSHNNLFKFSSFKDDIFYICETTNKNVLDKSYNELKVWNSLLNIGEKFNNEKYSI